MSEKQDVDKLKLLVKALDDMVEVAEKAMEDGKIGMEDVMLLPSLAPIMQDLLAVWKAKDELVAEAKDLEWEEIKELINEAMD